MEQVLYKYLENIREFRIGDICLVFLLLLQNKANPR